MSYSDSSLGPGQFITRTRHWTLPAKTKLVRVMWAQHIPVSACLYLITMKCHLGHLGQRLNINQWSGTVQLRFFLPPPFVWPHLGIKAVKAIHYWCQLPNLASRRNARINIFSYNVSGSIHPSDTQGPSSPSSPSSSSPHALGAGLCSGSSEPTLNAGCSGAFCTSVTGKGWSMVMRTPLQESA